MGLRCLKGQAEGYLDGVGQELQRQSAPLQLEGGSALSQWRQEGAATAVRREGMPMLLAGSKHLGCGWQEARSSTIGRRRKSEYEE